jgi:hypothetical protein
MATLRVKIRTQKNPGTKQQSCLLERHVQFQFVMKCVLAYLHCVMKQEDELKWRFVTGALTNCYVIK